MKKNSVRPHILEMYVILTAFFAPLGLIFGIPLIMSQDERDSKTGAFILTAAIICTLLGALIIIFLPDVNMQIGLIGAILFINLFLNIAFSQNISDGNDEIEENIIGNKKYDFEENRDDDVEIDNIDEIKSEDELDEWERIGGEDE